MLARLPPTGFMFATLVVVVVVVATNSHAQVEVCGIGVAAVASDLAAAAAADFAFAKQIQFQCNGDAGARSIGASISVTHSVATSFGLVCGGDGDHMPPLLRDQDATRR
jgi:hypothetical protein